MHPYQFEPPFKYRGNVLKYPPAVSYEPSKMLGDCDGEYYDECKEQGLLHRYPNRLAHVYVFGDNRFGQLGLSEKEAYYSRPQMVRNFLAFDWVAVAAGGRQTFWTSRVNTCSGNCNGHGVCNHDTGRCTCEEPWTYELDCLTAWCPNNCSGNGAYFKQLDSGDTGINMPLQANGPECACHYPYWGVDGSRAVCPTSAWGLTTASATQLTARALAWATPLRHTLALTATCPIPLYMFSTLCALMCSSYYAFRLFSSTALFRICLRRKKRC